MYVKLSIPERLKDLRVERHLTLEELAKATELSKSALGSYEADDYKDISPFSIVTLAEYYRELCIKVTLNGRQCPPSKWFLTLQLLIPLDF